MIALLDKILGPEWRFISSPPDGARSFFAKNYADLPVGLGWGVPDDPDGSRTEIETALSKQFLEAAEYEALCRGVLVVSTDLPGEDGRWKTADLHSAFWRQAEFAVLRSGGLLLEHTANERWIVHRYPIARPASGEQLVPEGPADSEDSLKIYEGPLSREKAIRRLWAQTHAAWKGWARFSDEVRALCNATPRTRGFSDDVITRHARRIFPQIRD